MNAARFLIAASLALTACVPAYVPPTRDDAAHLTLQPETKSSIYVSGFGNGKECRNRVNLAGNGNLKQRTSIDVMPDEEFTVLAMLADASMKCNVALTFLPKPRESYTAVIDGTPARCKMGIARFDGQKWVPEKSVRKRSWKTPWFSNSESQCD